MQRYAVYFIWKLL